MQPEFHDFPQPLLFATTKTDPVQDPYMGSNGMVHPERFSVRFRQAVVLAGGEQVAAGGYLSAPEYDHFTPYRVTCRAALETGEVLVLGFGSGPAVVDASPAGAEIVNVGVLAAGCGCIDFDSVVCISSPGDIGGIQYRDRPLAFFLTVMGRRGVTVAEPTVIQGSMTVESMLKPMPRFYDRRIG